jgi:hypothetical protein
LRKANPKKSVEVWAQDEARLGLKPITRRVWSPRGQRPRSCGRTRYQWLYLYGFVRPETGDTFGVLLPRVKAQHMSEALAEFAAYADPDGQKVLVVSVDNGSPAPMELIHVRPAPTRRSPPRLTSPTPPAHNPPPVWAHLPADRQKQLRELLGQLLARLHAANARKEAGHE